MLSPESRHNDDRPRDDDDDITSTDASREGDMLMRKSHLEALLQWANLLTLCDLLVKLVQSTLFDLLVLVYLHWINCSLNINHKELVFHNSQLPLPCMAEESINKLIRQLEMLCVWEDTLLWQIIQARAKKKPTGTGHKRRWQRGSQILHRGPRSNHKPNVQPHW
jgi:hypothetical protein